MKDIKLIVIFVIVGLALAHFVGTPLRKDVSDEPRIGTPLKASPVYAEGTITLAKELEGKAKQYPALFIIVRAPETQGPPIAVRRFTSPEFPFNFKLTEDDNMAGEGFYEGDIQVIARLDRDGAGGPRQAEDLDATAKIAKGTSRTVELKFIP